MLGSYLEQNNGVMEYYTTGLISPVSPWMKMIVSTCGRYKTCMRRSAPRVCLAVHSEAETAGSGGPEAAARSEALPHRQSAITHSSAEAGTHHGAEKQRSSPSQLNLTGVSGVNNETGRLALKVSPRSAHLAPPPPQGKKLQTQ